MSRLGTLFLSLPLLAADSDGLRNAFTSIRTQTAWPVVVASLDNITSTFGPRIRISTMAYDWHRGIDIDAPLGAPVVAAADGTLYNVTTYADGGLTVVLRHAFASPVVYKGKTLTYYYTFHMHLSGVAQKLLDADAAGQKPAVAKGEAIGSVGHSGSAVDDHLHFEVRVGTSCSLEYQLANPASSCAGWGFDPHMHPLWMFPPLALDQKLTITRQPTSNADGWARYESNDDNPMLNRVELKIVEKKSKKVVASHVLDFNERLGFDATSTAALDTPNQSKPYMSPILFGNATRYTTDIVMPALFVGRYYGSRYQSTLTATDIWNRAVSAVW
ncbi:MAG: M23 family metallopeptidase [Vicinamibacterales bacterium]